MADHKPPHHHSDLIVCNVVAHGQQPLHGLRVAVTSHGDACVSHREGYAFIADAQSDAFLFRLYPVIDSRDACLNDCADRTASSAHNLHVDLARICEKFTKRHNTYVDRLVELWHMYARILRQHDQMVNSRVEASTETHPITHKRQMNVLLRA